MSDVATSILNAAESRMRRGGFNGFSFRDIATDVGVKSSSVHYHFATKEKLAAAVIRRYTESVSGLIDAGFAREGDAMAVWTRAFRTTVDLPEHMCPCTVLGAAAMDLPQEVVVEVKGFFSMCREKMVAQGLTVERADELLATAIGAQVVSNTLGDPSVYDRAIGQLMRDKGFAPQPEEAAVAA